MSNTHSVRLLILDLDGTLADTLDALREAVNLTMRAYGWPEKTREDIRMAIGNGARMLIARSMPFPKAQDPALVDRVLRDYDRNYAQTYMHTRECYPGIPETLSKLCDRGYRLAVLSNKQDIFTKKLVRQLLGPLPSFVQGQTDMPKKPDPTVPLFIAKTLGFAPGMCAMIGDSDVDIQTGRNAGMLTVGCAWGFRGTQALEEAGAEHIAQRPEDLLSIFPEVIKCS